MGMSKHTEGPWVWSGDQLLARRPGHTECVLITADAPFNGGEADKALIAATPDMFEALKKARGLIDATAFNLHTSLSHNGKRNARPYFDAVAEIDALIAKAEGRS